jgi:hypothetical protein
LYTVFITELAAFFLANLLECARRFARRQSVAAKPGGGKSGAAVDKRTKIAVWRAVKSIDVHRRITVSEDRWTCNMPQKASDDSYICNNGK